MTSTKAASNGSRNGLDTMALSFGRMGSRVAAGILALFGATRSWWLPPALFGLISWITAALYLWFFWSLPIE